MATAATSSSADFARTAAAASAASPSMHTRASAHGGAPSSRAAASALLSASERAVSTARRRPPSVRSNTVTPGASSTAAASAPPPRLTTSTTALHAPSSRAQSHRASSSPLRHAQTRTLPSPPHVTSTASPSPSPSASAAPGTPSTNATLVRKSSCPRQKLSTSAAPPRAPHISRLSDPPRGHAVSRQRPSRSPVASAAPHGDAASEPMMEQQWPSTSDSGRDSASGARPTSQGGHTSVMAMPKTSPHLSATSSHSPSSSAAPAAAPPAKHTADARLGVGARYTTRRKLVGRARSYTLTCLSSVAAATKSPDACTQSAMNTPAAPKGSKACVFLRGRARWRVCVHARSRERVRDGGARQARIVARAQWGARRARQVR